MPKRQSEIEKLIAELCPEGVEWKTLGEACLSISAGGDLPKKYIKGQNEPTADFPFPIYSNGTEEKALYGYADDYRIDSEAVTISARGTIGYHAVRSPKFTPIVRLLVLIPKKNIITSQFFNYVLNITEIGHSGGSIPQLTVPNVKKIKIPIPPLAIQQEIVKILDTFTTLEAELEAELKARKKQYEYYRDELLTFGEDVEWKTLGECIEKNIGGGTPSKAISGYWNGDIPWASVGDLTVEGNIINTTRNFVTAEGLKNSSSHLIPKGSVIVAVKISPGKMKIAKSDIAINQDLRGLFLSNILKPKFLVYYSQTINIIGNGTIVKGITVDTLNKIPIPIPPLVEQERIVAILDRFDALVNDISVGLPAELNARRKQYEYYREKLLSFESL